MQGCWCVPPGDVRCLDYVCVCACASPHFVPTQDVRRFLPCWSVPRAEASCPSTRKDASAVHLAKSPCVTELRHHSLC